MLYLKTINDILSRIDGNHLAYSGGVDSTLLLAYLSRKKSIYTYTISNRLDHPDIIHARIGSKFFGSQHEEIIVEPNWTEKDHFPGDNAVRQLLEHLQKKRIKKVVFGDGIDELMAGYYEHVGGGYEIYFRLLGKLYPEHVNPLLRKGKELGIEISLPYLEPEFVEVSLSIPLEIKRRKIPVYELARMMNVPKEIMDRKKVGFCDAF